MARSAAAVTQARDPVERSWLDAVDDGDEHTAASLYLRAKRDANDRSMPPGARQEARHTMSAITERFPNARRVAAESADHELGIEGDADLKGVRDQHRTDVGVTAQDAAQARRRRGAREGAQGAGSGGRGAQGQRKGAQRPRPRTSRPARSGRGGGLWRSRRVRQTGIPGATESVTGFALQTLGLMIGLALAYRVLIGAQRDDVGFRFLEQGLGTITTSLQHLFDPGIDPLASRAPADTTRGAPSQAPGTAAGQIPGLGSTPAARNRPTTPGQLVPGLGPTVPSK